MGFFIFKLLEKVGGGSYNSNDVLSGHLMLRTEGFNVCCLHVLCDYHCSWNKLLKLN